MTNFTWTISRMCGMRQGEKNVLKCFCDLNVLKSRYYKFTGVDDNRLFEIQVLGQVVSATENQRFGGMADWGMLGGMSRPGSVMGAGGGGSRLGFYGSLPAFGGPGASRPPSGMSTVPGGPPAPITGNR